MTAQSLPAFQIYCTQAGTKSYPLHEHNRFEIMLYLSGNGYMRTRKGDYPFSPGTIIIIPPGLPHGSASEREFKNISIVGDFHPQLFFEAPVVLQDNTFQEGRFLAEAIYRNHHLNDSYLSALCTAFVFFVLRSIHTEDNITAAVNHIIAAIQQDFHDADFSSEEQLKKSGYAEDYIRSRFKAHTGKTPKHFLRDVRIQHACHLIEIYAGRMSLAQIGEKCGYTDYVYFSKKFKEVTGVAPKDYRAHIGAPTIVP